MTRPSTSARPLFRCQQCRFSSSAANSKPARIVASLLLARSPLIQPPLSSFEKSHYAYNKSLKAALSDDFDSTAYFAKGSQAERTFEEQQKQKMVASLGSDEPLQEPEGSTLQSVDRKQDRTLYLLLRKQRAAGQKGGWQFRESSVLSPILPDTLT